MDEVVWKSLESDLSLAAHVHLQGWGEPLLHPALPDWTRAVQRAGCTVGVTTNGDLFESSMDWLKLGNVDLITLSVAGDDETHAALRDGSQLEQILSAAGRLAEIFRERGIRAKVQLSYLLTRDNAASLPAVVERAAEAGLAELFVTHLDCRPCASFVEHAAFACHNLREDVANYLDEAESRAKSVGLPYRAPSRQAEEVLTCALDPLRFVFVGWDGRVGPCVNLLLPLEGAWPRWSEKGEYRVEPFSYGSLQDSRLSELLVSTARQRFTAPFRKRLASEQRFVSSLNLAPGAAALKELSEADDKRTAALASHPFPDACTACPKTKGW
jgi:MoaA/NifB/PqqE/SkfB family radical SAM enzyme